ncbi:MAG: hypothetical protein KZQ89_17330 [Candidatus Thiodiazotropha sp. (ex Lucinoma kastoroae)]|nr:hypothetical protein [Candidatus Thiodiazotropha sp. (ex Rostrolucina anterorostrata)]MCU7849716.1 hypothetical protein [Candidatus Thiodiazotropha sp. (ex Lucinoma kastoroae)]MCU7860770.1 hypothetical protein [Candidatus Thiodiazotropha sp. (ex Lucinoma kastoroae)]
MKIKLAIIIPLALLLSACHTLKGRTDHTSPTDVDLGMPISIKVVDGTVLLVDKNGKDISEPVNFPFDLKKRGIDAEAILNLENITIMTIKGSCWVMACNSGGCRIARAPDGPWCL